jgi:aspartate aminotransferase-like enzyme
MTFGRRFHAALADVHPEVWQVLREVNEDQPGDLPAVLARASLRLRGLFRTAEPVLTLPGPVAVLREIGLRAAVEHRVLVVVSGPDGEALAVAAEALGKEVIRVVVRAGQALEAAHLARFLNGPEVDTVALAHADLGTGSLAPLPELARVVRARRDLLLFVDATGSLGASPLETDQWGLDFVVGASEGPIGLPPGLAFACASPRLLARARLQAGRGVHLDLVSHHGAASRGQVLGPVPGALARALDRQLERILDREGLERRWARHAALAVTVDAWVARRSGMRLLAGTERRAHALSCVELEDGQSSAAVALALAEEGWYLTPAQATEPQRLRIGHMGDMEPAQLEGLLDALGRQLDRGAAGGETSRP